MFRDRRDAGRRLAAALRSRAGENIVVLALPRGGVPVSYEIARELGAPLDVLVVRKLGAPGRPELGLGAIAEGGAIVLDDALIQQLGVSWDELEEISERESAELYRRARRYRDGRELPELRGRTAIVVDDGIARGGTARAAIRAVSDREPAKIVLAAPVAARETVAELRREVDELVCLEAPESFVAVGLFYERFEPTTDEEVIALLRAGRASVSAAPTSA